MAATGVTRVLARYIVESRYEDLPHQVIHEACRAMLNWVGCAVGGSQHETVTMAHAAFAPFFGQPQAQILGRKVRADILNAGLINAISSHVLDFDDSHLSRVHPSAPVLPAALALAEWRKLSGAQLIHAFVLGVEAEIRIAQASFPEHYDRGYHNTGTAGVFGAAVAAGKLLELNEQQMTWALGIAATQSAGLREMFGSMCKSFHPGQAVRSGLSAALMADRGYTSSETGLEGRFGFGNVTAPRFDPAEITSGLGESYSLLQNMYKPFACGLLLHAALDVCLKMRDQHRVAAEQIASIHATVNPRVLESTGIRQPTTGLEGKFSIYHALAAAMVHGAAVEEQFTSPIVRDPRVIALRERVEVAVDPAFNKLECRMRIQMADGTVLDGHVERAIGTLDHPLSDADIERKYRALTAGILTQVASDDLVRVCWHLPNLQDVGLIARLGAA